MNAERNYQGISFGEVRPITPEQVIDERLEKIPSVIVKVFNEVIARNFQNGEAIISKEEISDIIKGKLNKDDVFEFNKNKAEWLDVKSLYSSAGWNVDIDPEGKEDYFASPTDSIYSFRKRAERP